MAKMTDDVFVEEVQAVQKTAFGTAFLILKNTPDCEDALIASLGMVLCLCIGAFSDALSVLRMEKVLVLYGYHRELLLKAISSDIILFAVPILAAIPYTTAFTDDVKSGYLKPFLTRTSVSRYIISLAVR